MEEGLLFLIMVDADRDRQAVLKLILDQFPDAIRRKANSCDLRGNWIEVWENEGADANLAVGEKGYLYFKWRVEVTPLNKSITEIEQVELARALLSCFQSAGCKAVVCADFEDKV